MYGRYRDKTRPQAQTGPRYKQSNFEGGLDEDAPATKIAYDEVALLENLIAFPDRLEGRSGTQRFSLASLPGSGTFNYLAFHPNTQKFLLHRGPELYLSTDATASSWTQVKRLGGQYYGTWNISDGQITSILLQGYNDTNTENGTIYYRVTNSGTTRTVTLYSDANRTTIIATGSRTGNGTVALPSSGNSGLSAQAAVTYTADVVGTIYPTQSATLGPALSVNSASKICAYKEDFLVFVDGANYTAVLGYSADNFNFSFVYVKASSARMATMGDGVYGNPVFGLLNSTNTESSTYPYGRRYLTTFSRIVDSSGNINTSLNRVSGTLVFESPANSISRSGDNTPTTDYAEHWFATPITSSATYSLDLIYSGTVASGTYSLLGLPASGHYTHISLYGTLDIGTTYGTDPVTGEGNSREIYVWIADVPLGTLSYSDPKSDNELRAAYKAGFGLRTRFWTAMPYSEIGEIAGSFLYNLERSQNKIRYCQLGKPEYLGYYRSDLQFFTMEDGVQELKKTGDNLVILCSKSTYLSDPKNYEDAGTVEPIFVLRGPSKISSNIGVVDYGSIADIDSDSFIAFCSDRTIRVFSGTGWGGDLAGNKVTERLDTVVAPGSVGAFISGVYLLWYKNAASDTTPSQCLRLGFGGRAGNGWCRITGSDFPFPPLHTGAVVINDSSSRQRLIVIDASDAQMHWVETFTNAALARVFKDGSSQSGLSGTSITATFRTRELTGDEESNTIYHEESHIFMRPAGSAYVSGFSLTSRAYVDGGSSASGTVAPASITGGDIQYFERIRGKRIQQEYEFSQSGFVVVAHDTHFQSHDTKAIADGPSETSEAAYQSALAGGTNLKHWLTRPSEYLNRATGSNFTYSGTAPTFVSGPDGKDYGLSLIGATPGAYVQPDGTLYSDFTLMFWVKDVGDLGASAAKVVQYTGNNNFTVHFNSAILININGEGTITIDTIASGWHHFAIVRSGSEISVYQNGSLKGRITVTGSKGGSSFMINPGQMTLGIYDVVNQNTALTAAAAAIAYYYSNVVNENGNKVLPLA